jgi:hypothetical protein
MLFQSGEKRRVSIAFESVTSEPTSGLDTYNALNIVESHFMSSLLPTSLAGTFPSLINSSFSLLENWYIVLSMFNLIILRWIERVVHLCS